jgi:hypothetical protein
MALPIGKHGIRGKPVPREIVLRILRIQRQGESKQEKEQFLHDKIT